MPLLGLHGFTKERWKGYVILLGAREATLCFDGTQIR